MTKLLSKLEILSAPDLPTRDVTVKQWGGTVRIKTLTAEELEEVQTEITSAKKKGGKMDLRGASAKFLVRVIVNEAGEPEFTEADIAALSKKSAAVIQVLQNVAFEMNGLTNKDLEELTGN